MLEHGLSEHGPGVYTIGGQGNSLVVDLGDNLLLVDAGPGGEVTQRMIGQVRQHLAKPVGYIVYSHGHMGYNNGVHLWMDDAAKHGEPSPQIVAHARVPARYQRYRETGGLQSYTNTRQFRSSYPADPPAHWFRMPHRTYDTRLAIHGAGRCVELLHAPSETDDGTAVWIPDAGVLYGSNAFIKTCPNVGSPYRIYRDPIRWAETLDMFRALDPKVLIPEFGKPLTESAEIEEALDVAARGLRYLRKEVVARMNAGMSELDIVHGVPLPEAIFGNRFMKPSYGCAEYIIRDIWRSENGWWNRNPTDLHPSAPVEAARAVRDALPDPQRVLDQAAALQAQGKTQLALHVIDLLALDQGDDPLVKAARALKVQLCEARSEQVSSVVSRNLYLSSADDLQEREIADGQKSYAWN
jgi:alkyl sulfatase BDS1-like metallo-beta-lactamase superfamily hydrolase